MKNKFFTAIFYSSIILLTACGGGSEDNSFQSKEKVDFSNPQNIDIIAKQVFKTSPHSDEENQILNVYEIASSIHHVINDSKSTTSSCESGTFEKGLDNIIDLKKCKNLKSFHLSGINIVIPYLPNNTIISGTIKFENSSENNNFSVLNLKKFSLSQDNQEKIYDGEIISQSQETQDNLIYKYDIENLSYRFNTNTANRFYTLKNYTSILTLPKTGFLLLDDTLQNSVTGQVMQAINENEKYISTCLILNCNSNKLNNNENSSLKTQFLFTKSVNGILTGDINNQLFSVKFDNTFESRNLTVGNKGLYFTQFDTTQILIEDTSNSKNSISIRNTTDGKALLSAFANGASVSGYPKTVDWSYFD